MKVAYVYIEREILNGIIQNDSWVHNGRRGLLRAGEYTQQNLLSCCVHLITLSQACFGDGQVY